MTLSLSPFNKPIALICQGLRPQEDEGKQDAQKGSTHLSPQNHNPANDRNYSRVSVPLLRSDGIMCLRRKYSSP